MPKITDRTGNSGVGIRRLFYGKLAVSIEKRRRNFMHGFGSCHFDFSEIYFQGTSNAQTDEGILKCVIFYHDELGKTLEIARIVSEQPFEL